MKTFYRRFEIDVRHEGRSIVYDVFSPRGRTDHLLAGHELKTVEPEGVTASLKLWVDDYIAQDRNSRHAVFANYKQ